MPRDFPRSRRIEDQIQRILSDVIRKDLRDPRFSGAFITAVRVTRDLSVAWVYYSGLPTTSNSEPVDLTDAFASAMGFLRGKLAKELTIRRVPELRFELDETSSNAQAMDQLIRKARARDSAEAPSAEDDSSERDD